WRVSSATDDYHAGLLARVEETRKRLRDLKFAAAEVGTVALHAGRLLGLEAVAHPATWRSLARRVLPAYALGAESARKDPEFSRMHGATPAEWLATVSHASIEARRARGKGYDVVIRNHGITGTCLWHEGFARHVAVFPN
ncbi:MAG TPA: DUF6569 family protein, partial [Thermomicrobiales bacterium]|nr:DUF6569 family protein [Thermomicrobiales bacterium]